MQIVLPKLGLTMTHGTITEWLKTPGDAVAVDEALCTYETEKVTLELTSPQDGVLSEVLVSAGESVPAGTPVCIVVTVGDGKQPVAGATAETAGRHTDSTVPPPRHDPIAATPKARALARERGVDLRRLHGRGPEGRIQSADVLAHALPESPEPGRQPRITPLARRMAETSAIDLSTVVGSGPDGTILREDIERALHHPSDERPSAWVTAATDAIVPLTGVRKIIGERMSQSAFSAPQVTLMTEAEATNLVSARMQLNQEIESAGSAGGKISFNTLITAVVARALVEHPYLNARLETDGIHLLSRINIALAVDTERGLMTPVLRDVDRLSLAEIQRGYDSLIARVLAGSATPDDFDAGTFTITNLGALDVDGFTPIINPPQSGILGVGRIVDKPVARDGSTVIRPMITLSLSFDHRVVDGSPAARFLQRVKQLVERPMALLISGPRTARP